MDSIEWLKKHGKTAQGKKEYIAYRETGTKLSHKKAILANCFQCTGGYDSGKEDCETPDCTFYPYMPFRKDKTKTKRVLTEKQQQAVRKLVSSRSGTSRIASERTRRR